MKENSNNSTSSKFLRTDGGKTQSNAIEIPSISLPKGGGAIKSIDEKFSVNAINGTASFAIPLPTSPSRGVSPELVLNYNSGSGNGVWGIGWSLSLGSIKRKTDGGLPQYHDSIDSDTFILSGAEDLVPEFKKDASGELETDENGDFIINEKISPDTLYTIRCYKPRIEGMFAKIERWTQLSNGRISWRVISKDNITTLFGWSDKSVISNPENPLKIFEWLPEFIFDDKGNCAHYVFKAEDSLGFNNSLLHNRNRMKNGQITYTNRYIEKVLYGNKTPYGGFGNEFPPISDYLFSTVFDYGEYNQASTFNIVKDWDFRSDAFSNYRAGFEIRTTRLCKRVMLFHHFQNQNEYDGLVKSVDFSYDTSSEQHFTLLKSVTSSGYVKKPDQSYSHKQLPPIEFEYQKPDWNSEIKSISYDNLVHAPQGTDEQQYLFTDLFNEGLSGILTEQAQGWFYKHNLGNGEFTQAKLVSTKPSFNGLGGKMRLTDLDGDGGKQLTNLNSEPKGYFEFDYDNTWQTFRTFQALPNIDFSDPNARLIDLNGDGKPDIVIADDKVFTWYPSEGKNGYSNAIKTAKSYDEESSPRIVFSDTMQSIFLADMSGDGLTDIVRIRNSEVCYWPNLGYGNFGAKVSLDNSPMFDQPDSYNPEYIRLADIDGSGTTDIIYLGKNKFTCWKNLNGNSFTTIPYEIESFPEIHNRSRISVTDLLGKGVACIVWASRLNKDTAGPLKYIDLMNGKKSHIMISYKNNLGKVVSLEYLPSTHFYLEDKKLGKPWITKLHFPVHCLSKTIIEDKISGHRFVTEYKYHHGYYDHAEKEFRGFGMVEQIDTETFEHWKKGNASNIVEEELHQEPIITKIWNHTGAFLQQNKILSQYEDEYWFNDFEDNGFTISHHEKALPEARLITASYIDSGILDRLSPQEWREASRACKGMSLRKETFAKDAIKFGNSIQYKKRELTPFSVETRNCVIELLQPKGKNKHAVYLVKESETISYNYERNAEDPRIAHNLNIKLDDYGNVLESASIVYPRKQSDSSLPIEIQNEQAKTVIIFTENHFTNDVISDNVNRLKLPSETKIYELRGVDKSSDFYVLDDFIDILNDANSDSVHYHEIDKALNGNKPQKRCLEHSRKTYYRNNLTGGLPVGQMESLALPHESYQLAFTPELVADVFGSKVNDSLLTEGKFSHSEGDNNWWVRSGTIQFKTSSENQNDAQSRFFAPISYTDPYGAVTNVTYYGQYFMFVAQTEDALGNKTEVINFNFRTLSPSSMRDINGNITEIISDELGFVKAAADRGKGTEADELTGFTETSDALELVDINNMYNSADSIELTLRAKSLLNSATTRFVYDLYAFVVSGKPAVVTAISREQHFNQLVDSPVQIAFEYSNGLGEVIMKKVQAEPGLAKQIAINEDNSIIINETNTASLNPPQLRWIGNGRTIKNNKGKPVKQYEPYFSIDWNYEDTKKLVENGVTPILYYDAAGRLVKTEMPNRVFMKVEFDSWKQAIYDANDTILESEWFNKRSNRLIDSELIADGKDPAKEKTAADNAANHSNTPNILHLDTLGRPILSIEQNKNPISNADEFFHTKIKLDSEGNMRAFTDARDNVLMLYKYDMLGNLVYQNSMDTGQRWMLSSISGSPVRNWDERDHEIQFSYDIAQRLTQIKVVGGDGLDNIFERLIYGESLLLPNRSNESTIQNQNILGQIIRHYDTGGLLITNEFDFKGHPIASTRKLTHKFKELVNWTDSNLVNDLESEEFTFITEIDALGRITKQITPEGSVITPAYNEAGLLESESVLHAGEINPIIYLKKIDYNEKGQRENIVYGNNVTSKFYYDKETFRLIRLETKRINDDPLQDWYYTYDPVGNITHIEDKNIPVQFFDNQKVIGISTYIYDALYRLTQSTGRESNAALPLDEFDNWHDSNYIHQLNPSDPMSVRNYTQQYMYDEVGNILQMKHQSAGNNWTRNYNIQANNNRLISTQVGSQTYSYQYHAQHGFIIEMPHLEIMDWNFKEELMKTARQKRNDGGTPETTYYQYDGNGKRIRKITENSANPGVTPSRKDERIYISGFELYRKHSGNDSGLERVSLSLIDEGHRYVIVETRNDIDDGTDKQVTRYQLHNHIGSAALELDENAQVISYEEYHPFGTTAYQARNAAIKSASKRYRFTGMERDDESGLSYHSARYYLPWLGRWLNADPIGIADGVNMYAYCRGNPIMKFDKSGLQSEPSNWNRFVGGLRLVGGVFEVVAGGGLVTAGAATGWTGIGIGVAIGGGAVAVHGVDTTVAGARMLWTGREADTLTSTGLQAVGVERDTANLADAGISVVGTLGAGAATRLPALAAASRPTGSLVHLTTTESALAIETSSTLGRGSSTLYAGTPSLAEASAPVVTLRTGLLPSQATTAVEISPIASQAFRTPAVVGPITTWQRASGAYYSAGSGTLNLTTGTFTRTGAPLNQYVFYGLDATITTTIHTVPAVVSATTSNDTRETGVRTSTSIEIIETIPSVDSSTVSPLNPADFSNFDDYLAAHSTPFSEEYLMETWASVHGYVSVANQGF